MRKLVSRCQRTAIRALLVTTVLALAACSLGRDKHRVTVVKREPTAPQVQTPRSEAPSRYGNPESYEVFGKRYYTLKSSVGFSERGIASWYGKKFHGRRTSSGEVYDMHEMTAAHKSLPLPTYVRVTNLENGRSEVLRVNDRGPFHDNRVIDLSYAAALRLGISEKGTGFVEIVALDSAANAVPDVVKVANRSTQSQKLYLQIGAFGEKQNAERLSKRITQYISDPVIVREALESGSRIYRVQVGPIATVESADHVVAKLAGLGISDHHIVAN